MDEESSRAEEEEVMLLVEECGGESSGEWEWEGLKSPTEDVLRLKMWRRLLRILAGDIGACEGSDTVSV